MKPPDHSSPDSHDESIEATAAAWLAHRDDGLTEQEEQAFQRWRDADIRHEKAVTRLEAALNALHSLQNFRPEAAQHPDRDLLLSRPRARPVSTASAWPVVAAAAVALIFVVAAWLRLSRPDAGGMPPLVYATTTGGFQRVALADGSIVELNGDSEARVEFTDHARLVELVRGEVNCIVAKNKERPFIVSAGRVAVRAVGTAFNVRMTGPAVDVLVMEGTVKVAKAEAFSTATHVVATADELATVTAGQRVTMQRENPARPSVETITPEHIQEALAWKDTRLVFLDTPLAEVLAQFNRRNSVQLVLGDASLGSLPVDGNFRAEDVDAFVRLITAGHEIVVERPNPGQVILRLAGR